MVQNRNKGLRSVVFNGKQTDVRIIGFSVEKNHKNSKEVDKSLDPTFTFHYILSGKGYAIINNEKHELTRNSLLVSFPNSNIKIRQDSNDPYTMGWFTCDGRQLNTWLSRLNITIHSPLLRLPENRTIRKIFLQTPTFCNSHYTFSDAFALSAFYQLMTLISIYSSSKIDFSTETDIREIHVANAILYINEHYSDPELNLSSVASFLSLTPKYLSSIFKMVTGNTFSNHLQNKRISIANTLIEQGETNITKISELVGFNSPYYFSNLYKKHNDISPKQHSKTIQEKK